jgi:hypothetical protein
MSQVFKIIVFLISCSFFISCGSKSFEHLYREKTFYTCSTGSALLLQKDTIVLIDRYLLTENKCTNIPDYIDKSLWPATIYLTNRNSFIFTYGWTAEPDLVNSAFTGADMFLSKGQVINGVYTFNKRKKTINMKIIKEGSDSETEWEKTFRIKYDEKQKIYTLIAVTD